MIKSILIIRRAFQTFLYIKETSNQMKYLQIMKFGSISHHKKKAYKKQNIGEPNGFIKQKISQKKQVKDISQIIENLIGIASKVMGNDKSGVNLAIRLDKQFYQAGDTVYGRLYINAKYNFSCSKIILEIEGIQECEFITEQGFTATGHNKLFKKSEILQQFHDNYGLKGDLVYPFTFGLLSHLPGSFHEAANYTALIAYFIHAKIQSNKSQVPLLKKSIQFMIRQSIAQKTSKSLYTSSRIECTSCFCVDRGRSRVDCFFQKEYYLPGDECNLYCQIDNSNCSLDIIRVRCRLIKQVTLVASNRASRVFRERIKYIEFRSVRSGQIQLGTQAQVQTLELINSKTLVPLSSITNGQKIKCRYFIQIKPQFRGFMIKLQGEVLNLKLNILQMTNNDEKIAEPTSWNPQYRKSKTIILSFSETNELISSMSIKEQKI